MRNNFDKYYDLIFSQKDYKREVLYIFKKTKKIKLSKILDVGCGTGSHSNLIYKNKKIKIIALDRSKSAIKIARNKNKNILFSTKSLKLIEENKFDLVISMFNVVNYFYWSIGTIARNNYFVHNACFNQNKSRILIPGRKNKKFTIF